MIERSYTVQEIDALRRACWNKYLWGFYRESTSDDGPSRSYNESKAAKIIEEQVRTWMLAGKTANDLLAPAPSTTSVAIPAAPAAVFPGRTEGEMR